MGDLGPLEPVPDCANEPGCTAQVHFATCPSRDAIAEAVVDRLDRIAEGRLAAANRDAINRELAHLAKYGLRPMPTAAEVPRAEVAALTAIDTSAGFPPSVNDAILELGRSTREQLTLLEELALGSGLRLQLGPVVMTNEGLDEAGRCYRITASQTVRLVRP